MDFTAVNKYHNLTSVSANTVYKAALIGTNLIFNRENTHKTRTVNSQDSIKYRIGKTAKTNTYAHILYESL